MRKPRNSILAPIRGSTAGGGAGGEGVPAARSSASGWLDNPGNMNGWGTSSTARLCKLHRELHGSCPMASGRPPGRQVTPAVRDPFGLSDVHPAFERPGDGFAGGIGGHACDGRGGVGYGLDGRCCAVGGLVGRELERGLLAHCRAAGRFWPVATCRARRPSSVRRRCVGRMSFSARGTVDDLFPVTDAPASVPYPLIGVSPGNPAAGGGVSGNTNVTAGPMADAEPSGTPPTANPPPKTGGDPTSLLVPDWSDQWRRSQSQHTTAGDAGAEGIFRQFGDILHKVAETIKDLAKIGSGSGDVHIVHLAAATSSTNFASRNAGTFRGSMKPSATLSSR